MVSRYFAIFIFFSQICISMEHEINDPWFVSRLVIKKNQFTQNKRETAIALEPFYHLQSYTTKGVTVTSAVKAIKRKPGYYFVYTLTGSKYKLPSKKLVTIDSIEAFYRHIDHEVPVYRRRNLKVLANDIKRGEILPGQPYKSWLRFAPRDEDVEIFSFARELKKLKKNREIKMDITESDLETINICNIDY